MIGYIARYRHIHSWVHKRNSPCMRTYNGQSNGRNNDMAGTVKINNDLSEEQIKKAKALTSRHGLSMPI